MSKLVPLLLVLLLAAVGWQLLEASSLRGDLERLQTDTASLRLQLAALERDVGAGPAATAEPGLRREAAATARAAPVDDGPRLLPRGADPEVIAQAVRELQERVTEQEARVQDVAEKVEDTSGFQRAVRMKPPIRNIEDAERRLELSGGQRADIERIVEYAKQDLEDLRNIPNADGKTWKDVESTKATTTGDGFTLVMTNLADVMKFRNTTIPGSSETYGEADQRIRSRANKDIRDVLTPPQQKTWDESPTHGLLGPSSGGATMISFASVTTTTTDEDSR